MVSAGAIRAGRANVDLGLDDSAFQTELRGIGNDLQSVGKKLTAGGAVLAGFGTAILAPLGAAAKEFAAVGDQLDKMSLRTGVAVEQLSALRFAAEQSGASLEAIETGIKGQARFLLDASRGMATQTEVLERLGLSYEQLKGLNPADTFRTLAVAVSRVDDETEKAGLSMKLFGRSGTELLPMLKQGADGIAALLAEAESLGIVMSTEDASAAAQLTDEMNRLSKTFGQIKMEVGAALAPVLTALSQDVLRPLVKTVVDWARENGALVVKLAAVGAVLVTAGTALAGFGLAMQGVGAALAVLSGSATGAAAAMGVLNAAMVANPAGVAIAALAVSVASLSGAFDPLLDKMREFIGLNAKMPGSPVASGSNPYEPTRRVTEGLSAVLPPGSGDAPSLKTPSMLAAQADRAFALTRGVGMDAVAQGQQGGKVSPSGPALSDLAIDIGKRLRLELDIKKTQVSRGLNIGKQWATEFWDGMEEERQRREGLFADIAAKQEQVAQQERFIGEQKDTSKLITASSSAATSGLGVNSIDQRQLDELEKLNKEIEKLRKEIAGDS